MTRYAQNGGLTRFDTGSTHEQNPLSGIPIGGNNSVEENETKQNNFVYSNRIFLDSNIISQYNLPKSLIGKSVADATKMIDDKFKGRNDKISQSTKDSMLSKIAEAQESMKPQDSEIEQPQEGIIDPNQMAYGGFAQDDIFDPNAGIGYKFGSNVNAGTTGTISSGLKDASSKTGLGLSSALSAGSTAMDLGKTAFGKPTQDTSGLEASVPVNSAGMIGGSALKGASAGMAFGPLGAGIGAAIGGVAGLLGSNKAKKAAIENSNNFAIRTNAQFSDQYAFGGEVDPIIKQPSVGIIENKLPWSTKKIVRYQPGVTSGKNGDSGFYLYSKLPTDSGFNHTRDREFIKQENMGDLQRTPQWQDYMKSQSKVNKFAFGGNIEPNDYYNRNNPYFMKNPGIISTMGPTPVPTESVLETSGLKSIGTTTPYTISTQPKVDISNANRQITPGPSNLDMLKFNAGKIGSAVNNNIGNLARYAPIAANALQLAQLKKPQGERLDRLDNRYKPEYVDEASLQNIADQTMNNTINAISQSGASEGQTRSSILGSQLQRTKALSDAYNSAASQNRATNDRAQTFNLGVDQVNLGQSNTEKENFAKDKGNYDTQKSRLIGQLGNDIGNVGKEEIYKKIAKTTTGYSWLGEYQKMNPDSTPEETEKAAKKAGVLIDSTTKKALGGYLLKNKGK